MSGDLLYQQWLMMCLKWRLLIQLHERLRGFKAVNRSKMFHYRSSFQRGALFILLSVFVWYFMSVFYVGRAVLLLPDNFPIKHLFLKWCRHSCIWGRIPPSLQKERPVRKNPNLWFREIKLRLRCFPPDWNSYLHKIRWVAWQFILYKIFAPPRWGNSI